MESSLQPHFVLIPLMCPGHLIPMVDIARLVAQLGVTVTLVTTPLNAIRFSTIIDQDVKSGLPIRLLQLRFPSTEVGLPEGCENLDSLPGRDQESSNKFMFAGSMLQQPIEQYLEETNPYPSCIIADRHLPWTVEISKKFQIPRLVFDGMSCFSLACTLNIRVSRIYEKVSDDHEPFLVPGLPDEIELTRAQLPHEFNRTSARSDLHEKMLSADNDSHGVVVNTFQELEPGYVKGYQESSGQKVWCIGPVSLLNKDISDKACRGNKSTIDENQCLKWLDLWPRGSVVYACLGTLSRLSPLQQIELGLGLEATNRPFIWVIKEGGNEALDELEKWLFDEGFKERTRRRVLLIRGWAPQTLILSHEAIGGFLTHCGWNSVIEGVSCGVPMITWPIFTDQFYNEKFVVKVLRIGVSVGAEIAMKWGEEEKFGVTVRREEIRMAIEEVMGDKEEGEERRGRAGKLGVMAEEAIKEGGSSHQNIRLLIEDVIQQALSVKQLH